MDLSSLRENAWQMAFKKIWQSAYHMYLIKNPDVLTQGLRNDVEIGIMDEYIKKVRVGIKFCFITVNPSEHVSLQLFNRKIQKCLKKVWVDKFMYVFEQRGENEEKRGYGMHAHILISLKKYKRLSDIKREVYNTFKSLVGNEMHVNVKSSLVIDNFANYILGLKKDINGKKGLMLIQDDIWRKENGLESAYGHLEYFGNLCTK